MKVLISSSLNIYSGGLLDHMVVSFLVPPPPAPCTIFHNAYTNLHSHNSPQPSQHFYLLIIAILTGEMIYCLVVFPCISLTTVHQYLFKQPRILLTRMALFVIGLIEVLYPLQPEICFSISSDLPCPFLRIFQKETDNIEYILTFKFPD